MSDIGTEFIPGPFYIPGHPFLNDFSFMDSASPSYGSAAPMVHSSHEYRLEYLDKCVMHILVGPLYGFTDSPRLLCTGIPPFRYLRLLRDKASFDYLSKLSYPVGFRFFYPCSAAVGFMPFLPMVCPVYLVYRFRQVPVRDKCLV